MPKNRKNQTIRKNTIDFSIFGEIFQSFWKSYILVRSDWEKNRDVNPEKNLENPKKPLRTDFQEIFQKAYKNIRISGEKGHRQRAECSRFPNLKKNSTLKARSGKM